MNEISEALTMKLVAVIRAIAADVVRDVVREELERARAKEVLTVREVAARYCKAVATIHNRISAGTIPVEGPPRARYFLASVLDQWDQDGRPEDVAAWRLKRNV